MSNCNFLKRIKRLKLIDIMKDWYFFFKLFYMKRICLKNPYTYLHSDMIKLHNKDKSSTAAMQPLNNFQYLNFRKYCKRVRYSCFI